MGTGILSNVKDHQVGRLKIYGLSEVSEMLGLDDRCFQGRSGWQPQELPATSVLMDVLRYRYAFRIFENDVSEWRAQKK